MIATATTKGIKISVEVKFEGFSPYEKKYVFSYQIYIENNSNVTVQLMRRHWFIHDSLGGTREVEGAGVVGEQPILKATQMHHYNSWCPLDSEIGMMQGTFLMKRKNGSTFKVLVPDFQMLVPHKMN